MQTIGAVAKQIGLKASAVRYYERQGIIRSTRLSNGYRTYDANSVQAIRFVMQARNIGITLDEVKEILAIKRQGAMPCGCVKGILTRHLRAIESKIAALGALQVQLSQLLQKEPSNDGVICPIIEEISDNLGESR